MTPKQLLQIARFARPEYEWKVTRDGTVMSEIGMFNLDSRADREAVQIRLFREKGVKINEVQRRGKVVYQAKRLSGSVRESASFEDLVLDCVGE